MLYWSAWLVAVSLAMKALDSTCLVTSWARVVRWGNAWKRMRGQFDPRGQFCKIKTRIRDVGQNFWKTPVRRSGTTPTLYLLLRTIEAYVDSTRRDKIHEGSKDEGAHSRDGKDMKKKLVKWRQGCIFLSLLRKAWPVVQSQDNGGQHWGLHESRNICEFISKIRLIS